MRGFPVGYCTTSYVDPQKGLFYVNKPISEIAYWEPIEVIYLLYHGKEGSKSEVKKFEGEINKRLRCSKKILSAVHCLPRTGHAMKLFSAALLILGMHETTEIGRASCRERV